MLHVYDHIKKTDFNIGRLTFSADDFQIRIYSMLKIIKRNNQLPFKILTVVAVIVLIHIVSQSLPG